MMDDYIREALLKTAAAVETMAVDIRREVETADSQQNVAEIARAVMHDLFWGMANASSPLETAFAAIQRDQQQAAEAAKEEDQDV